jgi:hypothetical protein
MRYIERATLRAFKCYEEADLELSDVNIFAGPNNSGKSALIAALRRLASVNVNRHRRIAHRAGKGFWGSQTELRLVPGDMRDSAEATGLSLVLGPGLPLPERHRIREVHARFHPVRGTTLWSDDQASPSEPDKIDESAIAAIQTIERLPIVVIPEVRSLPTEFDIGVIDSDRFREEQGTPADVYRQLVRWACESPGMISVFESRATMIVGAAIRVRLLFEDRTLMVQVGDDAERPIHFLGSGIAAALTLAATLTAYPRGLLLYEEPELHFHPRLQRQICRVLRDVSVEGPWQVLLTTHSNHILDFGSESGVSTFSVDRADGASRLAPVIESSRRSQLGALLEQLGVRPSSVLQTQALIWVEGPSDAIYLRFFLSKAAERLGEAIQEYVDYSFAFLGGALVAHAALQSDGSDTLIDLMGIHRKSFVVLDSDREAPEARIGKPYTEAFLKRADPSRVWITDGREIENYLDDEILIWAALGDAESEAVGEAIKKQDRRHGVFASQVVSIAEIAGRQTPAHRAGDARKAAFAADAVRYMSARPDVDWLAVGDLAVRATDLARFVFRARA